MHKILNRNIKIFILGMLLFDQLFT